MPCNNDRIAFKLRLRSYPSSASASPFSFKRSNVFSLSHFELTGVTLAYELHAGGLKVSFFLTTVPTSGSGASTSSDSILLSGPPAKSDGYFLNIDRIGLGLRSMARPSRDASFKPSGAGIRPTPRPDT
jgi:hypothetical protein